eukprot:1975850-Prorocentrum_lima.AAC.1
MACDTCDSQAQQRSARVAGSPGSNLGRSGTNDCNILKIMLSSAEVGEEIGAGSIAIPGRGGRG